MDTLDFFYLKFYYYFYLIPRINFNLSIKYGQFFKARIKFMLDLKLNLKNRFILKFTCCVTVAVQS